LGLAHHPTQRAHPFLDIQMVVSDLLRFWGYVGALSANSIGQVLRRAYNRAIREKCTDLIVSVSFKYRPVPLSLTTYSYQSSPKLLRKGGGALWALSIIPADDAPAIWTAPPVLLFVEPSINARFLLTANIV